MEVYLVRHGEAKPESNDPERPLTDSGMADVESLARYIANLKVAVSQIRHSGKLRARQTAEIFGRYLAPPHGVIEHAGLAPNDDPRKALAEICQATEPLMIVGHLPHLSRLASLLLSGNVDKDLVRFRVGGVVCLSSDDGGWALSWALDPEIVRT